MGDTLRWNSDFSNFVKGANKRISLYEGLERSGKRSERGQERGREGNNPDFSCRKECVSFSFFHPASELNFRIETDDDVAEVPINFFSSIILRLPRSQGMYKKGDS